MHRFITLSLGILAAGIDGGCSLRRDSHGLNLPLQRP